MPAPERESRPWSTYLAEPGRAPSRHEPVPSALEVLWTHDIGRSATGPVGVGDSVVVAQASDRTLAVFHRASGAPLWRTRLNGPAAAGALFTRERVYAASGHRDGRVYAYDLPSGKRRWSREVGPVMDPLALSGTRVFAATRTGVLVALDAAAGDVLWRRDLGRPLSVGATVIGRGVLVATDDSLYVAEQSTGTITQSAAAPAAVIRPPAVADGVVVFASPEGVLAAIDSATLETRWRVELDAAAFASPAIARDTAFVTTLAGTLWGVPLAGDGDPARWEVGGAVRAGPAPVRAGVLVGTIRGTLWLVGAGEGPAHVLDVRGPLEEPPVVVGGVMYLADGRGRIHAWGSGREAR